MPKSKNIAYGNRTLKVELHFWTSFIAKNERILPKVAWDSGTIHILKNTPQGIQRRKYHFGSLSELQPSLEKAFKAEGIRLKHSTKYRGVWHA